jgi:proteasome assembly chaperone (PAC2) family protein
MVIKEQCYKMIINKIKNFKSDNFVLFASLPDIGKVGGISSSYLAENLKTDFVAEIISNEKPWVIYKNGVVKCAVDCYQIYYSKDANLLIFTGNTQPQDSGELYQLCNLLLDYIQEIGHVKLLYSSGGYLKEQLTGAPKVCGVVNNPDLRSILTKFQIELIGNEIDSITWFNGLILGLASERKLDAIGLFGEISETSLPQPLAAKSIVKAFSKIEGITLNTKPLDKQYEAIVQGYQDQKNSKNSNPGIA